MVSWRLRGEGGSTTWGGRVSSNGRSGPRVQYERFGCRPFPPQQPNVICTRVVVARSGRDPDRQAQLAQMRVHGRVGSRISVVGSRGRFLGTIVSQLSCGQAFVLLDGFARVVPVPVFPGCSVSVSSFFIFDNGKRPRSAASVAPSVGGVLGGVGPPALDSETNLDLETHPAKKDKPTTSVLPVLLELGKKKKKKKKTKRRKQASQQIYALLSLNVLTLKADWLKQSLVEWLLEREACIACFQETRLKDDVSLPFPFNSHSVPARPNGQGGLLTVVRAPLHASSSTMFQDGTVQAVVVDNFAVVVNVWAPHGGKKKHVRETWWQQFVLTITKLREMRDSLPHPIPIIIMGDLNARIDATPGMTFKQRSNDTTDLLRDLCLQFKLTIGNGSFKKKQLKLTTFRTQRRCAQLDVILYDNRFKSRISDVQCINPPIPSDHRALIMKYKVKWKRPKLEKSTSYPPAPDYSLLSRTAPFDIRDMSWRYLESWSSQFVPTTFLFPPDWKSEFFNVLRSQLEEPPAFPYLEALLQATSHPLAFRFPTSSLSGYSLFASATRVASEVLPSRSPPPTFRDPNPEGRALHRKQQSFTQLKRSFEHASNSSVTEMLNEFEACVRNQPAKAWKLIDRLVEPHKRASFPVKSSSDEILAHWKKINGTANPIKSPSFTRRLPKSVVSDAPFSRREIQSAIAELSTGKAVGLDDVPAEVFKLPDVFEYIFQYANEYIGGLVPKEVLLTRLAMVPKKSPDLTIVANYRPVSIVSTFLKLVNRALLGRLRTLDPYLRPGQNGFRPLRGTVSHALALQILIERYSSFVAVFVDFTQAFPSVTHAALRESLQSWLVPDNMINAILQCYSNHTVVIKLPSGDVSYTVETGVLQGDTLAPYLFVLLLDSVMHASIDPTLGLPLVPVTSGTARTAALRKDTDTQRFLTDMSFADDICLISPTCAQAERQLQRLQEMARSVGLEMNFKAGKTEYVCVRCDPKPISSIDGTLLVVNKTYTYLGTMPFDVEAAFKSRVKKAWFAVHKLDAIWKCPSVPVDMKCRFLVIFVQTVFSYGGVCWPRTQEWTRRVDMAFTRMLRYVLHGYDSDIPQLYNHGGTAHLSSALLFARLQLVGHAIRHGEILGIVLTNIPALAPPGSRRHTIISDTTSLLPLPMADIDIFANNRNEWYDWARTTAFQHEEGIYRRYWQARRRRWSSLPRLETRMYFTILEHAPKLRVYGDALSQGRTWITVPRRLIPLIAIPRVNTFFTPVRAIPMRPARRSQSLTPTRPRTRWLHTPAVEPPTPFMPTSRSRRRASFDAATLSSDLTSPVRWPSDFS